MPLIAHRFPGLSANVWLPDWIQVEVKLIKNSRFYSNTPSKAHVKTTWHDTGNPNTNANQEWTWANNGRQGAGVGGYNGIYDDTKIIITQDFATEVWAAGTPIGNKTSYHFEQAWGGKVDFQKSLEIGAALHGAICAAKGWDVAKALVQHHAWYGKDCPGQIRRKGIWGKVVAMTTAAATAAHAAESGTPTDIPETTYAKPVPLPVLDAYRGKTPPAAVLLDGSVFFYAGYEVEAIANTPRLQLGATDADRVGPDVPKGERFPIEWLFVSDDGNSYAYTKYATRFKATDLRPTQSIAAA